MRKHAVLFQIIALISTFSCVTEADTKQLDPQLEKRDFPIIISPISEVEPVPEIHSKIDFFQSSYEPYFIGKEKDSIVIDYYLAMELTRLVYPPGISKDSIHEPKLAPYYREFMNTSKACIPAENSAIEIFVDTSQIITGKWEKYPVRLKNLSEDTVCIGTEDVIFMIMEAKDASGQWEPIEQKFDYFCGKGVGTLLLPPDEIVISGALKYNGTFRTECRLVLGNNISNTFLGSINPCQFSALYE